jgi:hypothetical protein
MSASATIASIKNHLCDLQMPGSLEAVDGLLEQLDHGSLGPPEAMEQLLVSWLGGGKGCICGPATPSSLSSAG